MKNIIATLKHYVGNKEHLKELVTMQDRIVKAQNNEHNSGRLIIYRLALGTPDYTKADSKTFTPKVREGILKSVDYLREYGIDIDFVNGFGIGEAFLNSAFDWMRERSINYKKRNRQLR